MVIRREESTPRLERKLREVLTDDNDRDRDAFEFDGEGDSELVMDTIHPVTKERIQLNREEYEELTNSSDIINTLDTILARKTIKNPDDHSGVLEKIESPFTSIDGQIQVISKAKNQNKLNNRAATYNWSVIRKDYVLGKRVQLSNGTWVSEDYTLKEIALKYGISYYYLKAKSASESWQKLRKAYLARVNSINVGQELGLYTSENYQAEVAAMNACNKLSIVLNSYLEYKFGDILDISEDINKLETEDMNEEVASKMNAINSNTGTPIFINELKEAIKVTSDIYKLQRSIYDNSPNKELDVLENLVKNKPRFKTEKARKAKIAELQAKLSIVLNKNESLETYAAEDIYEDQNDLYDTDNEENSMNNS